jgi:proteic killer suppression protein
VAIRSFKDPVAKAVFEGERPKQVPPDVLSRLRRRLAQIEAAERLEDLRVPPGNRLEALAGDREGQHSVRVNQQWRVCFVWAEGGAEDVEFVDYH